MNAPTRPWVSIAAGVSIAACAFIVALGVRAVFFVREHVKEQSVTPAAARSELAVVSARFAGHQPLIEVRDGREPVIRRRNGPGSPAARTLRALIYDAQSGRLIRDDLSFGVLRVVKSTGFKYLGELTPMRGDTEFERDRVDVTLEDIQHHGDLVLDHRHHTGSEIIIWVE